MSEKKLICQVCQKAVANTANVLARHLRSIHNIEWDAYVVKYEHGGQWPTCVCGCGERLVWRKGGFGKYAKGHDNQGAQNSRANVKVKGPGWNVNPFTNKEENLTDDLEVYLLNQCIESNDPVTREHSVRIPWEDQAGRLKMVVPAFQHLQKKLVLFIDRDATGFSQRLVGIQDWCEQHNFMALVLSWDTDHFNVIGSHRRKDAKG